MLIRRLWVSDLAAFRDHLHRLDHETLHDRFGSYASPSFLDDYARTCLTDSSIVYGCFVDGEMRGAGELRFGPDSVGELALSVESGWRRRNIGTQLLARVARAASFRRLKTVSILCAPHNLAMLELARKFDAELQFEQDSVLGRLVARRLTPLAAWSEYVEDSLGFVDACYDAQRQLLKSFFHTHAQRT